jgi:Transglutaminase-like superfamily
MAPLRSIRRLLVRFAQVDWRRRALVVEAALSLLVARLALIFVSFSQLARCFGTLVPPGDARLGDACGSATNYDQAVVAKEVSWAVTRVARYVPFRAVCLPQAMAAHNMLRRRGVASIMHFGAAKGQTKPLDAHAWLDAAGVEVTGYPVEERLTEIACWVGGGHAA